MNRAEVILAIAQRILALQRTHPVRVGIDGVTAAGRTTLADELAAALRSQPREVIRASIDAFHNPPGVRYRLGRMSPEGYYRDAIDHASVRRLLLGPLGPGGSRRYRIGAFGQPEGATAEFEEKQAPDEAILLVDGVFLFRPELNGCWDYRVFIQVDPLAAMERGIERDAGWIGSPEEARARYERRYAPGERLYLDEVQPWELADVVIENDVPADPKAWFRHGQAEM